MKSKIPTILIMGALLLGVVILMVPLITHTGPEETGVGPAETTASTSHLPPAQELSPQPGAEGLPAQRRASSKVAAAEDRQEIYDAVPQNFATTAPAATAGAAPAAPRVQDGMTPIRASTGGSGWGLTRAPPSRASIQIDGGEIAPQNFSGHYQRVVLERRGTAEIRVEFPGDEVSQQVLVRAIHGGKINGGENYAVFNLDGERKEIAFTFESGREAGISEIILRRGTTEEVIQFWAPTAQPEYDPPALKVKN